MAQILAKKRKDNLDVTGYDSYRGNLGQADGI